MSPHCTECYARCAYGRETARRRESRALDDGLFSQRVALGALPDLVVDVNADGSPVEVRALD